MDWIINIIKDVIGWLIPRMQVRFEINIFDRHLVVKNISKKMAYNVQITGSEDTFWVFGFHKSMNFEPGREVKIPFTLVGGHNPHGTVTITYSNKKNKKQKKIKFPVTV